MSRHIPCATGEPVPPREGPSQSDSERDEKDVQNRLSESQVCSNFWGVDQAACNEVEWHLKWSCNPWHSASIFCLVSSNLMGCVAVMAICALILVGSNQIWLDKYCHLLEWPGRVGVLYALGATVCGHANWSGIRRLSSSACGGRQNRPTSTWPWLFAPGPRRCFIFELFAMAWSWALRSIASWRPYVLGT